MKRNPTFAATALAAALALGLSAAGVSAQQPSSAQSQAKPPSPAAVGYAKEILALKNANAMYASAVPNIVQRTKDALLQSNLNYQKDLNEVAPIVAQSLAGREKEVGEIMARVYAADFTEQELKDLVTFYKSPLGAKLLAQEPRTLQTTMAAMGSWAQGFGEEVDKAFRVEMRKRGKQL